MQPKDPNDVPKGLKKIFENVTTYQAGGNDTTAEIQQLKTMLAKSPDNLDIKEWLAFKLYSASEFGEAEGLLRDLIAKNHRVGVQAFYLGNLLQKTGREKEAVEYWKKTISLMPEDIKAKKAAARIAKLNSP